MTQQEQNIQEHHEVGDEIWDETKQYIETMKYLLKGDD